MVPLARQKLRFVGDIVRSPVHGRVAATNFRLASLSIETPVYQPHTIVAPVDGTVLHIDACNGQLQNGLFASERDKEASLMLHILCAKSEQMITLVLVVKPHGATARLRLWLTPGGTLRTGTIIGYAGGKFETRVVFPPNVFLATQVGTDVHGLRSTLGTVYRTV